LFTILNTILIFVIFNQRVYPVLSGWCLCNDGPLTEFAVNALLFI